MKWRRGRDSNLRCFQSFQYLAKASCPDRVFQLPVDCSIARNQQPRRMSSLAATTGPFRDRPRPCCAMRNTLHFTNDPVVPAQGFETVLRNWLEIGNSSQTCKTLENAIDRPRYRDNDRRHGYPGLQASCAEREKQRPLVNLGEWKLAHHVRVP